MLFTMITTFLTATALLPSLIHSSPIPLTERDTAELYILADCYNNHTHASYAEIFWYYPDFLPDYPEPQAVSIVNAHHAVPYVGMTTHVTTNFTLTAVIPANASTAAVGTLVSTNASASSFAGPMAAFKGSGLVFYTPSAHVNCVEEYYVQDHQTEDDF